MIYQVQLLKGLFHPALIRYQLKQAESVKGFLPKVIFLFIISILLFAVSGLFGIGSETISKEVEALSAAELESKKQLFILGRLFAGILFAALFLFLSAMFFWLAADISYIKLVSVQMIVLCIGLFEKALLIPISVAMDINKDASPFALGVIGQHFTSNGYLIHFLGEISIFQVLMIALQYYFITNLSNKNKYLILGTVVVFYLLVWLVSAFLTYINISVIV
ncbi:hypothetical protein D0469_15130 [Peribacillus saganii]|uniref:Yip1 domain-containing protein n=1 Tax=Peribacillus saganii TaxID=2303992 RepID=A0A372LLC5_9BACI|nr:hypothetical protein [Peribacillus saganii]RFU67400.1 hypothetical protein D0469_15130 [Peribacillus saganii]